MPPCGVSLFRHVGFGLLPAAPPPLSRSPSLQSSSTQTRPASSRVESSSLKMAPTTRASKKRLNPGDTDDVEERPSSRPRIDPPSEPPPAPSPPIQTAQFNRTPWEYVDGALQAVRPVSGSYVQQQMAVTQAAMVPPHQRRQQQQQPLQYETQLPQAYSPNPKYGQQSFPQFEQQDFPGPNDFTTFNGVFPNIYPYTQPFQQQMIPLPFNPNFNPNPAPAQLQQGGLLLQNVTAPDAQAQAKMQKVGPPVPSWSGYQAPSYGQSLLFSHDMPPVIDENSIYQPSPHKPSRSLQSSPLATRPVITAAASPEPAGPSILPNPYPPGSSSLPYTNPYPPGASFLPSSSPYPAGGPILQHSSPYPYGTSSLPQSDLYASRPSHSSRYVTGSAVPSNSSPYPAASSVVPYSSPHAVGPSALPNSTSSTQPPHPAFNDSPFSHYPTIHPSPRDHAPQLHLLHSSHVSEPDGRAIDLTSPLSQGANLTAEVSPEVPQRTDLPNTDEVDQVHAEEDESSGDQYRPEGSNDGEQEQEKEKEKMKEMGKGQGKSNSGNSRSWKDEETDVIIKFVFADPQRIEEVKASSVQFWRKAIVDHKAMLPTTRNASSLKSRFERLMKTYHSIIAYEAHYGGRGGPNEQNDPNVLQERLDAAQLGGANLGSLYSPTVVTWYKMGWVDLFNEYLAEVPNRRWKKYDQHGYPIATPATETSSLPSPAQRVQTVGEPYYAVPSTSPNPFRTSSQMYRLDRQLNATPALPTNPLPTPAQDQLLLPQSPPPRPYDNNVYQQIQELSPPAAPEPQAPTKLKCLVGSPNLKGKADGNLPLNPAPASSVHRHGSQAKVDKPLPEPLRQPISPPMRSITYAAAYKGNNDATVLPRPDPIPARKPRRTPKAKLPLQLPPSSSSRLIALPTPAQVQLPLPAVNAHLLLTLAPALTSPPYSPAAGRTAPATGAVGNPMELSSSFSSSSSPNLSLANLPSATGTRGAVLLPSSSPASSPQSMLPTPAAIQLPLPMPSTPLPDANLSPVAAARVTLPSPVPRTTPPITTSSYPYVDARGPSEAVMDAAVPSPAPPIHSLPTPVHALSPLVRPSSASVALSAEPVTSARKDKLDRGVVAALGVLGQGSADPRLVKKANDFLAAILDRGLEDLD